MEEQFAECRYYIQQDSDSDSHAAVFRLSKPAGGSWQGHYWDRKISNWQREEDLVRRYWNGFDPDVTKASEAEALAKIKQIDSEFKSSV